jgi:leader peptidase (prepilin peptidase) / N-methyltransferase
MGAGACVAVLAWLAALSIYDVRQRRLPNFLTMPGAAVVIVGAFLGGRGLPAIAGAAALGAVYLLVHVLAPTALGAGDVKLAFGLGALTGCFGVDVWALAAIAGPLLTALWAIVELIRRGARAIPHGPAMCLASVAASAIAVL